MTPDRMRQLNSPESDSLTADEMRQGWHFCPDWDFMLVNVNDTEGEGACCTCGPWTEQEVIDATGAQHD